MAQAQQPKNLEEALQVIQQQNELINQLKVALQLQQHRQFAKKNESLNPDQLSLFEEMRVEATDSEEPSDAAVEKRESSRHPKLKKSNSRKENLDSLPQKNCEYDLDDKTCPDCHQEMKQIGRRLAQVAKRYTFQHIPFVGTFMRRHTSVSIVIPTVAISWLPPRRRVRCLITAISQAASWQRLRLTNLIWPCRLIVRNACGKQLILNWILSRWQMR